MNFGHLTHSITNNNYGQYYDKYPRQHTNENLALKQVTLYRARNIKPQSAIFN